MSRLFPGVRRNRLGGAGMSRSTAPGGLSDQCRRAGNLAHQLVASEVLEGDVKASCDVCGEVEKRARSRSEQGAKGLPAPEGPHRRSIETSATVT